MVAAIEYYLPGFNFDFPIIPYGGCFEGRRYSVRYLGDASGKEQRNALQWAKDRQDIMS
jgi:hypothetical protein